jgi:hypothetical protein
MKRADKDSPENEITARCDNPPQRVDHTAYQMFFEDEKGILRATDKFEAFLRKLTGGQDLNES